MGAHYKIDKNGNIAKLGSATNSTFKNYFADAKAFWKLDEGTGSVVNDALGVYNGTMTNATWANGVYKTGLDYGNAAARAEGTTSPSITGNFSVAFWIKPNSSISGSKYVFRLGQEGTNVGFGVKVNASTPGISIEINDTPVGDFVAIYLALDDLNLIIAVYNGANVTVYCYNAYGSGSTTINFTTNPNATTNYWKIGNNKTNNDTCGAIIIDEVGIWDKDLSAAEALAIYNSKGRNGWVVTDLILSGLEEMTGGAGTWFQPPKMTTAQRNTMTTTWGAGEAGREWYNTTTSQWEGWNGAAIVLIG